MDFKTVDEFFASESMFRQSMYFTIGVYHIYLRRHSQLIDERKKVITVANISRIDDRARHEYNPDDVSTGHFKELLAYLDEQAMKYGYEGVMFESVHNTWLLKKLQSYGFHICDGGINLYRESRAS